MALLVVAVLLLALEFLTADWSIARAENHGAPCVNIEVIPQYNRRHDGVILTEATPCQPTSVEGFDKSTGTNENAPYLVFWNRSGRPIRTVPIGSDYDVSPNGRFIAIHGAHSKGTLGIEAPFDPVMASRVIPDVIFDRVFFSTSETELAYFTNIASNSSPLSIKIFSFVDGSVLPEIPHTQPSAVRIQPTHRGFLGGCAKAGLCFWDLTKTSPVRVQLRTEDPIDYVVVDQRVIVIFEGLLEQIALPTGQLVKSKTLRGARPRSIQLSSNSRYVVIGYDGEDYEVRGIEDLECFHACAPNKMRYVRESNSEFAIVPDGEKGGVVYDLGASDFATRTLPGFDLDTAATLLPLDVEHIWVRRQNSEVEFWTNGMQRRVADWAAALGPSVDGQVVWLRNSTGSVQMFESRSGRQLGQLQSVGTGPMELTYDLARNLIILWTDHGKVQTYRHEGRVSGVWYSVFQRSEPTAAQRR